MPLKMIIRELDTDSGIKKIKKIRLSLQISSVDTYFFTLHDGVNVSDYFALTDWVSDSSEIRTERSISFNLMEVLCQLFANEKWHAQKQSKTHSVECFMTFLMKIMEEKQPEYNLCLPITIQN